MCSCVCVSGFYAIPFIWIYPQSNSQAVSHSLQLAARMRDGKGWGKRKGKSNQAVWGKRGDYQQLGCEEGPYDAERGDKRSKGKMMLMMSRVVLPLGVLVRTACKHSWHTAGHNIVQYLRRCIGCLPFPSNLCAMCEGEFLCMAAALSKLLTLLLQNPYLFMGSLLTLL